MELTNNNYFSKEANLEYFSVSQFKDFDKCEACALAKLNGEFEEEKTIPMMVGSYVDRWFEGTLDEFKVECPEIFTQKGELKAQFKGAEEVIERVQKDKLFMEYMSGEKQTIMTAELFGYMWKIKVDSLCDDKIVDLKVMKDFAPVWKDGERMHFIEAYGYDIQGAIYQAIVEKCTGKKLPFYIAAATKEKGTDIAIFEVPQEVLDRALSYVEAKIDHIAEVKDGFTEAEMCNDCEYCRSTKVLTEPIDYREVL